MPNFNSIGSGVSEPQVAENRYLPLTGGHENICRLYLSTAVHITNHSIILSKHEAYYLLTVYKTTVQLLPVSQTIYHWTLRTVHQPVLQLQLSEATSVNSLDKTTHRKQHQEKNAKHSYNLWRTKKPRRGNANNVDMITENFNKSYCCQTFLSSYRHTANFSGKSGFCRSFLLLHFMAM